MSVPVPRVLLLDTSGRGGLVAVALGEVICGRETLDETRRHTRDLVPVTARLLGEQGWRARDLDAVVISLGPGSYTGLRVGLIAAKSLAFSTGCALIGVESFAVIAGQVPPEIDRVDVLADAQQERVYVQSFRRGLGGMEATDELRIRGVAEWLETRDPSATLSGPWVEAHRDRLKGLSLIESPLNRPTAEGLLRIGLSRYLSGARDDLWSLEPIYLRPSAAEEQWERLGRTVTSGPGRDLPSGG